jgi:HK97 family phage portal protein
MQLDAQSGLFLPSDFVQTRGSLEDPNVPLTDFDRISEMTGGSPSASGVRVNGYTVLTYGPVFRAVTLIAGDLAKIPLITYRRTAGDGKIRAYDHHAYQLLRYEPNEMMTADTFWRTLGCHKLLWGNAYAYIETNAAGEPIALLPLLPDRTEPEIDANGQLWYRTRINDRARYFYPDEVLHFPGLGWDGLKGYSVISLAKNSIGLGLAAEAFAAKFYKNGAKVSGVLTHPRGLSAKGRTNLTSSFEEKHTGLENSHRVVLLEEGAKFIPLSVPPNDAQFLETRQQQVREAALWFGVPPHKLGDNSRTAYNSLEEENASYITDTLDGHFVSIEQECRRKLLTREQRQRDSHACEFLRQALLRASMTERYQAYALGITQGFLNRDEVRAAENLNPIPGGKGKDYLVPLNMAPAGSTPAKEPPSEEAKSALLADTLRRMARIEADHLLRMVRKQDFFASYAHGLKQHRDRLEAALAPVLAVVAPTMRAAEAAEYWHQDTITRIAQLSDTNPVALDELTREWIEPRVGALIEIITAEDGTDSDPE